jgi:two-component system, probable response regulator PhcQ
MSHTILIVDDEPEILDSLRRTLRREPYRVVLTPSPVDAVRILDEGGIDVLVSDVDMPGMSGLDLVAYARRAHPDVVRVLLTGVASAEGAIRAINEGEVHRFLTKPWSRQELTSTLRGAIDRLDELRRDAAAGATVTVRERLLQALEREHPGIGDVPAEGEVYQLDRAHLSQLAASANVPSARGLLAGLIDPHGSESDARTRTETPPGRTLDDDGVTSETLVAAEGKEER